jgi:glutamine amidotransferase
MANLQDLGLIDPLKEHIKADKPLLGICLGMQLLLTYSAEFGKHKGLGVVPGKVVRLADDGGRMKIPHVGWNKLSRLGNARQRQPEKSEKAESISWADTILDGTKDGAFVYFVHSFFVIPDSLMNVLAVTTYGSNTFCSALKARNVYGCQFHPERSGHIGLDIYRRFTSL